MSAKPLRVVEPGEKTPARKLSITQAASNGSEKELYVALRDRLAKAVEDPQCPPRDLAALSRRLTETAKDIAAIEAREAEDGGGAATTPDADWEAV